MSAQVLGIGGIFFRAEDPDALNAWYRETFGILPAADHTPWQAGGGLLVFSAFKKNSDYYPATQQTMINFRVKDLDAFLTELAAKKVRIDEKRMNEPYGKFAWVYDPEGNKIELWQEV